MKLHITEKALNEFEMPKGKAREILFDQEVPGFAVQVTEKGAKTYILIFRDADGRQRQERIARVDALPAQTARALAKSRLDNIRELRNARPVRRRTFSPTMDEYFYDVYLPIVKNQSRSYETHASMYRNHIQPFFGQRRLGEISEQDVVAFNTKLKATPVAGGKWAKQAGRQLSDGTVKRVLILLRHLFNVAIRDKDNTLIVNPTHVLQLRTVRKIRGRFLTREQLSALLKAAEESDNKAFPDIIRVMAGTGLRRANVLAMEWAWLDEARGTLTVPPEADKAKKGFLVYLSSPVLNLLCERRKVVEGRWVFPNPKTGKPYHSCRWAWGSACNKANLKGLRVHDLRHTYASMMLESGADIVDVQRALGHTQLKTTAVYLHLTEGRKRERANAAAEATGLFA